MLNFILNNINVWNLNKNIAKLLYFIFNFGYWKNNIEKGDTVKCLGIGYPHWRNQAFIVKTVFYDGHLILHNNIKLNKKDFIKYGSIRNKKR